MPEPQKKLDSVKADSGLGKELEENCRRYTDDQQKLACLESSRNTIGHTINGMNEEARKEAFTAERELKNARDEIKQNTSNPERIPTPAIGKATVADKVKK